MLLENVSIDTCRPSTSNSKPNSAYVGSALVTLVRQRSRRVIVKAEHVVRDAGQRHVVTSLKGALSGVHP